MFTVQILLPYIIACLIFSIVPGPGVTAIIANSLAHGASAGLFFILGTEIAMFFMVLVVAFGLELVVQLVGEAFFWIKLAGAAYLIWIGFNLLRSSGKLEYANSIKRPSARKFMIQGALVNLGNPKTLLFLGAFLPQFVPQGQESFENLFILGLIVMVIATITDSAYAILAGAFRTRLTQTRLKWLNRVAGTILIGGGVWLASARNA